ncbi:MAG TPA: L-threonylcarbamoyladenylate synthase [Spirochaetota bacterium]|nr:L-threonylcarbamoyladenylate synthase [Spirochaetota bacterium]
MIILKDSEENIKKAAEVIKKGGLVAFPTETVYGLGADATNPEAVAKIFEAKERPYFDPLIVHIANKADILKVAQSPDRRTEFLIERFWPGPLTVILKKRENIPDIVTSGLETVAVRMPSHETALSLIRESSTVVAAPSANKFSSLSPTTARHVFEQLGNAVDFILDGGQCLVGIESTIVKIEEDSIKLLRPGGIPKEAIEDCLSLEIVEMQQHLKVEAPGQLDYHYSPQKPVVLVDKIPVDDNNAGFLFFTKPSFNIPLDRSFILSADGDLREAAANLFLALHFLDSLDIKRIYAQRLPEKGLGLAIMDRLKKASMKFKNFS